MKKEVSVNVRGLASDRIASNVCVRVVGQVSSQAYGQVMRPVTLLIWYQTWGQVSVKVQKEEDETFER
jgi:hypothetical protein